MRVKCWPKLKPFAIGNLPEFAATVGAGGPASSLAAGAFPARSGSRESAAPEAEADWQEEINFWDKELSLYRTVRGGHGQTPPRAGESFPSGRDSVYGGIAQKNGRPPRVLDAGCGPLPYLSYGHLSGMMDLVGADPLAEVYLPAPGQARLSAHRPAG